MHSALEKVLRQIELPAIAVSGGVDSTTLAAYAAHLGLETQVMHAVSPAVPEDGTRRVKVLADQFNWHLTIVSAGEFDDPNYRANPVNRCFYCKTNLYDTIRSRTDRQILSGANTDDLGEYRPGLDAARDYQVRHPYVEAGLNKLAVRQLARELGLEDISQMRSSPCLSSRVETGIRIDAGALGFIYAVEQLLTQRLNPTTVRCRIRAGAVVIELDPETLGGLDAAHRGELLEAIATTPRVPANQPILFEEYRNGSAFLVERL